MREREVFLGAAPPVPPLVYKSNKNMRERDFLSVAAPSNPRLVFTTHREIHT
jgi:hypothetical protein